MLSCANQFSDFVVFVMPGPKLRLKIVQKSSESFPLKSPYVECIMCQMKSISIKTCSVKYKFKRKIVVTDTIVEIYVDWLNKIGWIPQKYELFVYGDEQ
jgi:hypothetical protein